MFIQKSYSTDGAHACNVISKHMLVTLFFLILIYLFGMKCFGMKVLSSTFIHLCLLFICACYSKSFMFVSVILAYLPYFRLPSFNSLYSPDSFIFIVFLLYLLLFSLHSSYICFSFRYTPPIFASFFRHNPPILASLIAFATGNGIPPTSLEVIILLYLLLLLPSYNSLSYKGSKINYEPPILASLIAFL